MSLQRVGQIEFERSKPAFVRTKQLAIAPRLGVKIRCANCENYSFAGPFFIGRPPGR